MGFISAVVGLFMRSCCCCGCGDQDVHVEEIVGYPAPFVVAVVENAESD